MKRSKSWVVMLAALSVAAAACGLPGASTPAPPAPTDAEVEGGLEAIEVEEPTLTPTPPSGSTGTQGLGFEWTHTHGGGMVTSGSAYTCDGQAWHIDFAMAWIDVDFSADTTGALDFEVVDGTTGTLELPTQGTIVVPDSGDLVVEDPLDFSLTLHDDGQSAALYLASTGAGIMYPHGGGDSDEMGTVFPGEEIEVMLTPYTGCGGA